MPLSRKPKKVQRFVECTWCGESVTPKCVLRHMREKCTLSPKESPEQKFCSVCQKLVDRDKFSRAALNEDGHTRDCKPCSLAKYHEWRKNHPEPRRSRTYLKRPGRWVFHECPHCGEQYSHNALVYHAPRCPKKIERGGIYRLNDTIVVPDNTPATQCSPDIRDTQKARSLKFHYGLSLKEWDALFAKQGGVCAICKEPRRGGNSRTKDLVVDHCHVTGKIRGLLCYMCNTGLGKFLDNVDMMKTALAYLETE